VILPLGLLGLVAAELVLPGPPPPPPTPPPGPVSSLLGLLELAMENTPESAWLAGESLFEASRGDSLVACIDEAPVELDVLPVLLGPEAVVSGEAPAAEGAVAEADDDEGGGSGQMRLGEYVGRPANANWKESAPAASGGAAPPFSSPPPRL